MPTHLTRELFALHNCSDYSHASADTSQSRLSKFQPLPTPAKQLQGRLLEFSRKLLSLPNRVKVIFSNCTKHIVLSKHNTMALTDFTKRGFVNETKSCPPYCVLKYQQNDMGRGATRQNYYRHKIIKRKMVQEQFVPSSSFEHSFPQANQKYCKAVTSILRSRNQRTDLD